MRATDLYNRIGQLITSNPDNLKNSSQFHKRLSSYFIEKGLTRKRYSDGIYYYCIQDKVEKEKEENKSTPCIIDLIIKPFLPCLEHSIK